MTDLEFIYGVANAIAAQKYPRDMQVLLAETASRTIHNLMRYYRLSE